MLQWNVFYRSDAANITINYTNVKSLISESTVPVLLIFFFGYQETWDYTVY